MKIENNKVAFGSKFLRNLVECRQSRNPRELTKTHCKIGIQMVIWFSFVNDKKVLGNSLDPLEHGRFSSFKTLT